MRILPAITICLALAAGVASGSTRSAARASLRLADMSPLTVRGAYFKARERVRVTVTFAQGTRIRVLLTARRAPLRRSSRT